MAGEIDFSILQHRCSDECLSLLRRHPPTMVHNQKCPDNDSFADIFAGFLIAWFVGRLVFRMYSKLRTSWFPWVFRCCTFWSKAKTTEVSVTRNDAEPGKLIQEIAAAAETGKPETRNHRSVPNEGELDCKTTEAVATEKVILSANLNPDQTENTEVVTAEIETNEENNGEQKHGNIHAENEADLRANLKYMCKMCVVKCNGEANWNAHVVGRKHQGKICQMMKTAKGNYLCSYCDVDCKSWSNFGSHLNGKKHLSNIQEVLSGYA